VTWSDLGSSAELAGDREPPRGRRINYGSDTESRRSSSASPATPEDTCPFISHYSRRRVFCARPPYRDMNTKWGIAEQRTGGDSPL